MIKDSKLIGTKIDVPFGWKQFKVGELFDCKSIRQIPTGLDLDSVGDIPYVAQTSINNSITHYITEKSCLVLNKGHAIVLGVDTQWATYQEFDFYANKMISLYLKSSFSRLLTASVGLYMCSVLNKNFTIYDYNRKLSFHKLVSTAIDLPVTSDSQPDFEWMSAYIKAVKADYLAQKELANQREIKDYLTAGKVDSMDVTDADRQFVRDFEKLPRRKFKVGYLFDVCTTTGFDAGKLVFTDNGVPFIGRTDSNYGIQGYLHNMPDSKPNPSNVISISQIGSQSAQYRKTVWYASQNMFYVELLNHDLTLDSGLFFVGIFNKILQKYLGYTSYPTKNSIFNWIIELPVVDSSQVDVQSIEKYMQIQSKPLINKVAETLAPVGGDFN